MNSIVEQVENFARLAQKIENASKEQATGVIDISKAIQDMNTVSNETSSVSTSVSGVSQELLIQAQHLNEQVNELNRLMGNQVSDKNLDDPNRPNFESQAQDIGAETKKAS